MGWQDAPVVNKKSSWQDAPLVDAPKVAARPQTTMTTPPEDEGPSNWAVLGESLTREAPANILGFPMDMIGMLGDTGREAYIGMTQGWDTPVRTVPPIGGSEWMKENLFREIADREDYSGGQKLLGNVLTLGAEGLTGGAGMASRAKYAKEAPGMIADMTKPYMSRPVAQTVQDTAGGMGAGGGLTYAEENDMGPIGTLFSTLISGMSAVPAAKMVEGTGRNLYSRIGTGLPDGTKVRRQTLSDASRISDELVTDKDQAIQNIDQSIADSSEMGVANPTLGPASGDVGLSMLEVKERLKNPQPFIERDQKIRTDVANKFGEFSDPEADVTAPQRKSSQMIDDELNQQQSQINDLGAQKDLTEQQLRDLQREGQQIPSGIEARRGAEGRASAALDEQLQSTLDERTTTKNQKFDESAEGAYVEAESLAKLVNAVNREAPKLAPDARLPDYIMKGIRKFIPQPGTLEGPNSTAGMIPAKEVLGLRKYLNTEIQSLKQKGEFTKADTLQSFKSKLNETIELDPNFKEANDFYKTEYAPFFAEGYGKKYRDNVQRGDGTGKADAENIASFFLNKTTSAADDLKRIVEIAPDKRAADSAIETYFDAMLAKKTLNPKTIRDFITDNADILPDNVKSKYEGVVKSMMNNTEAQNKTHNDLTTMKRTIRDAEANLSKTERELSSGPLGRMSRYDSDKYVGDIMGSKDRNKQLDEVISKIGDDKEAMDGFKEATVQWLQKKIKGTDAAGTDISSSDIEGRPIVYSKLTRALDDNREALSKIFDPEEMNTLNRMHKIMSRQGNLARRATSGSDTAEKLSAAEQQVMDVIEATVKLKFGMLTGGGLFRSVKLMKRAVFGESGRSLRAEDMLTRMAFDPKVAKHVLEATPLQLENGKWLNDMNKLMAVQSSVKEASDDEDPGDHEFR